MKTHTLHTSLSYSLSYLTPETDFVCNNVKDIV